MISQILLIELLVTMGNLVFLINKKDRQIDRYFWTTMILIPVIILGYWLKSVVHTQEAVMVSLCFIYLDRTMLLVIVLFSVLRSIRINVPFWVKAGVYGVTVFHLLTIWLSKDNTMFYESINIYETSMGTVTKMTAGPLKYSHYVYSALILGSIVAVLVFGFIKKGTHSKKALFGYSVFTVCGLLIHGTETFFDSDFSFLPSLYTAASVFITLYYDSFQCHNFYSLIGEKQSHTDLRGFIAFDKHKRLLGYNRQFEKIFPDITHIVIDGKIEGKYQELADYIYPFIDKCINQGNFTDCISIDRRFYDFNVSSFSVRDDNHVNGYMIEIVDVTEDKNRIDIIEKYNERLNSDVREKTKHIVDIQNLVVLGMANLVESRDNNTGGHVKRTSDIIKILIEEASRQKLYTIDPEKAADIVRAAPMHDLGKMYIDTAILCKPGRLTAEEFVVMKTHAPKSGEMVKIILDGVEEKHFVDTAFNIARHHHERWDGKGYPDGLMGESIPFEARIMAVADVYDALVSKRCYKEAMSFEDADRIMNENMGSQFDPAMGPVFNACREQLEKYYSEQ